MSRDDTICIFKVKNKYFVIHEQGIEDLMESKDYFNSYCKLNNTKWTYNKKTAYQIAHLILLDTYLILTIYLIQYT